MNKKYTMSRKIWKTLPMVALAASLLLPGVAASAVMFPIVVNKSSSPANPAPPAATGANTCYDEAGTVRACAGTGEDGEHQLGATASPRFIATDGGETQLDNLTGLTWLTKANCINTDYSSFDQDDTVGDAMVTWQHAFDFVTGMNAGTYSDCSAGHADWRLPNIKELQTLIDFSNVAPALPTDHAFTGVQSDVYWSSSSSVYYPHYAWHVYLSYGYVGVTRKLYTGSVWPVRGRQ